jgi:hypothetical protein
MIIMYNKVVYSLANLARKIGVNFNENDNVKVLAMKEAVARLNRLEFKIEYYPDGSWTAESTNLDGVITGGKNTKDINATIKDAVFTYFEIPPHLCVDSLLRSDNEPVIITQRVYA